MPLTNKQQEYLNNCNHRWSVKTGATGSGKTFVDIAREYINAIGGVEKFEEWGLIRCGGVPSCQQNRL